MTKAKRLVALAESQVGAAYVFGSWGVPCTVAERKKRATYKPQYAEKIQKYCPVLFGIQKTCAGCKYEGKLAFDCRGLTDWACNKAGIINLYGDGATTQWNTASNWEAKGTIGTLPNKPCVLFRQDGNSMGHTGIYNGAGYVIHAKGHAYGVVRDALSLGNWTHWAVPKGTYDEINDGSAEAGFVPNASDTTAYPTVKKGSKGDNVKTLQEGLLALGYSLPKYGADGDFGGETLAALKAFQTNCDLTVDGICGPATWTKLDAMLNAEQTAPPPDSEPEKVTFSVTIHGLDAATVAYLLECYPGAVATETVG